MAGKIGSDPLFVGLTRPTMIFGVSIHLAMLNIMISISFFIQTSSIFVVLLAGVIHGVGYLLCFREPRFIELYLNKMNRCNRCSNKVFHGANSYSV